jgi:sigma-B regulation protein RsbQ
MGGIASVLASLLCPHRIGKLILIGASARYLNDEGYHGGFEQTDLDKLYNAVSASYYTWAAGFAPLAMRNADRPELSSYFADSLSRLRPDIALGVLRLAFQSDYRSILPRVHTPTWVLQTRQDIAVPLAAAEYLATHIPGAQLSILNAEGHLPHVSAPGEINHILRAILGK